MKPCMAHFSLLSSKTPRHKGTELNRAAWIWLGVRQNDKRYGCLTAAELRASEEVHLELQQPTRSHVRPVYLARGGGGGGGGRRVFSRFSVRCGARGARGF